MTYDPATRAYRDTRGWTLKAVYRALNAPSPARSTAPSGHSFS